jgi:hypothetical protein
MLHCEQLSTKAPRLVFIAAGFQLDGAVIFAYVVERARRAGYVLLPVIKKYPAQPRLAI